MIEKETEEEGIEIEERFGNDIDRNLRELEALGWFGFSQVRKDIKGGRGPGSGRTHINPSPAHLLIGPKFQAQTRL